MASNMFSFLYSFGFRFLVLILFTILFYIYFAYSWQIIAKKLGYKKYWIAWIPIVQLILLPILSKKKWYYGLFLFLPYIYFFISYVFSFNISWLALSFEIIYLFLTVYWTWIIFERRNFPGYLSLIYVLSIIPFIDVYASILYFLTIGVVAVFDIEKKKKSK